MVKRYARSAAGVSSQKMNDIRSITALHLTLDHLFRLIEEEEEEEDWMIIYEFVSDRIRAVRQDVVVADVEERMSQKILERVIPFYITAGYRCERFGCSSYNRVLHETQLNECISRWTQCRLETNKGDEQVFAMVILISDDATTLGDLRLWRSEMSDGLWSLVVDMTISARMNNFIRYIRLLPSLPTHQLRMSAWRRVPAMRQRAIRVLTSAYKSRTMRLPLDWLMGMLAFDSIDDLVHCLDSLNMKIVDSFLISDTVVVEDSMEASNLWHKADHLINKKD